MKARIIVDDIVGRFHKGEIGEVLENNFAVKYDYFIEICKGRAFYFYEDEVELIEGDVTK